ncbi:hypothetical protein QUF55_06235 [Clostridiaceae bacterium HSG29]|nr:hypothetical protein [Clostridiaceae bacterium HSG29]
MAIGAPKASRLILISEGSETPVIKYEMPYQFKMEPHNVIFDIGDAPIDVIPDDKNTNVELPDFDLSGQYDSLNEELYGSYNGDVTITALTQAYYDTINNIKVGHLTIGSATLNKTSGHISTDGMPMTIKTQKVNGNNVEITGYYTVEGITYYSTISGSINDGVMTGAMKFYKESTLLLTCNIHYLQNKEFEDDEIDPIIDGVEDLSSNEYDFSGKWSGVMYIPKENVDWEAVSIINDEIITVDKRYDITETVDTTLFISNGKMKSKEDSNTEIIINGNKIVLSIFDQDDITYIFRGTMQEDKSVINCSVELISNDECIAKGTISLIKD